MSSCPCGSGQPLDACCGPIIAGAPAPTAEALMRSRYTAVTLGAIDHLEATHAPEIQGEFNRSWAELMARDGVWHGLEIREVVGGGPQDDTGEVEFAARFQLEGTDRVHHERSSFRRADGRWLYVAGEMNPKGKPRQVTKIGRNEPCPCGSGKKYKDAAAPEPMERHFLCTVCGQCCRGWLPLTLAEALALAGRFPLAMIWTPVRQGAKAHELTARIGTTVQVRNRRSVALRITPTAYIPPALTCPALGADMRCTIHADKPLRCRTMPFFPYREEEDQLDTLIPRKDWACDVSAAAPLVYRDKRIVDRTDFDRERQALLDQAPLLRGYADWLLAAMPPVREAVLKTAEKPAGGDVVLDFASVLPRLPRFDVADFARRQLPVLRDFAARTAGMPTLQRYHQHYRQWAKEMERLAGPEPAVRPAE